jgi:hypothetical protein
MSRSDQAGVYTNDYPPEFQQYNTQFQGRKEWIGWRWWDTQTFTSATTVNLPSWFNVRATPDLSNMEVAFQLAAPKAFFWRATRLYFKVRPGATTAAATANPQTGLDDDIAQILNTGVLEVTIGNKIYSQDPLWMITAGGGVFISQTQAGASASNLTIQYAQPGPPDPRAVDTRSKPLFIAPQINFTARMFWPAAITLANGNPAITVALDGDLIRPVQ